MTVNPCSLVECGNGSCIASSEGVAVCQCFTGFAGDFCETNINDCEPDRCQNDATCEDGIDSFTCKCLPDFIGELCETRVNDCTAGICQNGGQCTDGVESFTCDCRPNFAGTMCETCLIPNCAVCSQDREGECTTCSQNYRQGFMTGCGMLEKLN